MIVKPSGLRFQNISGSKWMVREESVDNENRAIRVIIRNTEENKEKNR